MKNNINQIDKKNLLILYLLAFLGLSLLISSISLSTGVFNIPITDVFSIVFSSNHSGTVSESIIYDIRLPRILLSFFVGIGLSISDPLKIIAKPYKIIKNKSIKKIINDLDIIIKKKSIEALVVGLPIGLNGEDTKQTRKVRNFKSEISKLNIKIYFEDERLSSVSAIKSMVLDNIKTGHNKEVIDMRSAAIILQQFLDKNSIQK